MPELFPYTNPIPASPDRTQPYLYPPHSLPLTSMPPSIPPTTIPPSTRQVIFYPRLLWLFTTVEMVSSACPLFHIPTTYTQYSRHISMYKKSWLKLSTDGRKLKYKPALIF